MSGRHAGRSACWLARPSTSQRVSQPASQSVSRHNCTAKGQAQERSMMKSIRRSLELAVAWKLRVCARALSLALFAWLPSNIEQASSHSALLSLYLASCWLELPVQAPGNSFAGTTRRLAGRGQKLQGALVPTQARLWLRLQWLQWRRRQPFDRYHRCAPGHSGRQQLASSALLCQACVCARARGPACSSKQNSLRANGTELDWTELS